MTAPHAKCEADSQTAHLVIKVFAMGILLGLMAGAMLWMK